jgi:ubiquinone/menaquinone biosynthesis C-methylase UbiE
MNEETAKAVAAQLRKPDGVMGIEVGERMNTGNFYMNQYVIDLLKKETISNVLEIGMGNGIFVKEILGIDNAIRYTGSDYSETMIAEATKRNEYFIDEGRVRFDLCSASKLPYKENTFDTVFTVNTIYFWEKPEEELSEIRRVLKPGGRFIIAVRPKDSMKDYPFVKYGFAMFGRDELANVLNKNQFVVSEIVEKQEPEVEFGGQAVRGEALIMCAKSAK